jgi:hypothetical protein
MTEYLILIYERESGYAEGGQEAWESTGQAHARFAEQVGEKGGKMLGGNALQPTATATSIRDDVVTDGPFAETKEALLGVYVVDCPSLEDAIELAQGIGRDEKVVFEIRPVRLYESQGKFKLRETTA